MLELCTLDIEPLNIDADFSPFRGGAHSIDETQSISEVFHSSKGTIISIASNIGKRDQNLDKVPSFLT